MIMLFRADSWDYSVGVFFCFFLMLYAYQWSGVRRVKQKSKDKASFIKTHTKNATECNSGECVFSSTDGMESCLVYIYIQYIYVLFSFFSLMIFYFHIVFVQFLLTF